MQRKCDVTNHMRTCGKIWTCNVSDCNFSTKRSDSFQFHKITHLSEEERPYQCTFIGCKKGFGRKDNFQYHINKHYGIKPYICKFTGCQMKFTSPAFRSIHGRNCQYKP